MDYIVDGRTTKGFAPVAWPATDGPPGSWHSW